MCESKFYEAGEKSSIKSCYFLELNFMLYHNYMYKNVQSAYKTHIK